MISSGLKGIQLTIDSSLGTSDRKRLLIQAIVKNLCARSPDSWVRIDATYAAVGSSAELSIGVDMPDGPYDGIAGPIGFPKAIQDLRDLMYVPGEGTWFTLNLIVESSSNYSTDFNYERPPANMINRSDLEEDLIIYPRNNIPRWIQDVISGGEVDRNHLLAEPAHPDPSGVRYMKLVRVLSRGNRPDLALIEFREYEGEWFESRKIQTFGDGRVELAGGFVCTDSTYLDEEPVINVESILRMADFRVEEISPEEFQQEWIAEGGW